MHDWLGIGLTALGVGLIVSAVTRRQGRMRAAVPAGTIRPEFAAMGEMMRPLILFVVVVFAVEMTLFYFLLGGRRLISSFDFASIIFVLASYAVWFVLATKRPAPSPASDRIEAPDRSAA